MPDFDRLAPGLPGGRPRAATRPDAPAAPRRGDHGRQRALGEGAGAAPRRGPPPRGGGGARHGRGLGPARPRGADPLRLLGGELEAAALRDLDPDEPAQGVPAARAAHAGGQRHRAAHPRPLGGARPHGGARDRARPRRHRRRPEHDPQHRAQLLRALRDRRRLPPHRRRLGGRQAGRDRRGDALARSLYTAGLPDPDLLIRTSARCASATSCSGRSPTARSG